MDAYSVLLVDDDKKLLAVLQECFQQENFTVYTAGDGRAGRGRPNVSFRPKPAGPGRLGAFGGPVVGAPSPVRRAGSR